MPIRTIVILLTEGFSQQISPQILPGNLELWKNHRKIVYLTVLWGINQICSFSSCQTYVRLALKSWFQNLVNTLTRSNGLFMLAGNNHYCWMHYFYKYSLMLQLPYLSRAINSDFERAMTIAYAINTDKTWSIIYCIKIYTGLRTKADGCVRRKQML